MTDTNKCNSCGVIFRHGDYILTEDNKDYHRFCLVKILTNTSEEM